MGFADRRYAESNRSWRGGSAGAGEWSAVTTIVVANCAVWVACLLAENDFPLARWLAMRGDLPQHPLEAWRLITYGFAHDMSSPWHLALNMLTVWFFGPEVESRVGRNEFLRFWLAAIVIAGLTWLASVQIGQPDRAPFSFLVGASGAVMAILAVFVWHNPHQELLLWGILPIPAWALGLLYFFSDVNGAYHGTGNVAHFAHIGGALFGLAYAWRGWNIGDLLEAPAQLLQARRRFRVVRPDDDPPPRTPPRQTLEDDEALREAVDRILEKISRSGEASLTPQERDTLTLASRRLKERLR
jgi:membrane associated rhomboid family serine protease